MQAGRHMCAGAHRGLVEGGPQPDAGLKFGEGAQAEGHKDGDVLLLGEATAVLKPLGGKGGADR